MTDDGAIKSNASTLDKNTSARVRKLSSACEVKNYPSSVIWSAAMTCLVSGVMCNMAVKLQNRENTPVCDGCESKSFDQPFWQTLIMFSGETFCFFTWAVDTWMAKRNNREHGTFEWPAETDLQKARTPMWWWALPAAMDLTGTALVNMAFTMTYVSTVQMLRNSILIVMAISQIILLQRPIRVHEWLGILIMTIGMVASGIQAIVSPDSTSTVSSSEQWLGIVLTLVGTVFSGMQTVLEEKLGMIRYCPPLFAIGSEGLFGFAFNVPTIAVAHAIKAYNFKEGWYQMNHNRNVLIGNLWYLAVVYLFNGSGLITTMLGSGVLRGVIYSMRAPILFLIELACKWQSWEWGSFVGLVLSVIGFFCYAYFLPGLGKDAHPNLYSTLRKGVPCFCTKRLPDSDEESDYDDDDGEDGAGNDQYHPRANDETSYGDAAV